MSPRPNASLTLAEIVAVLVVRAVNASMGIQSRGVQGGSAGKLVAKTEKHSCSRDSPKIQNSDIIPSSLTLTFPPLVFCRALPCFNPWHQQ